MLEVLLSLIFIRPFISTLAFPYLDLLYSCALLIFTAFWIIFKGIASEKIQAFKFPLLLFYLALIISTIFSVNKSNSLNELFKYTTCLSVFLVASSLSQEQAMRLAKIIVFTGFIISLLAIYQYFFGLTHTLDYLNKEKITNPFALDYISRKRVFLPFITPNVLAGYLIMLIPLALISKARAWFIIPLSIALTLTKSLGGILSLFAALTVGAMLSLRGVRRRRDDEASGLADRQAISKDYFSRRIFGFAMTTGFLIIVGLIIMARYINQKEHAQPLFSALMRLNYWKDTLEIIKMHLWVGIGPGNFNLAYSRYAHNSYLQIWAEMGIMGIISILWLLIAVLRLRHPDPDLDPKRSEGKREGEGSNSLTWLFTALLAFLFHNLIDFTFFLPEVAIIWWAILGLLITEKIPVR